ncbi:MFS transporter [uncultured Sphingosinicella sp.]|uniref:MFS transporter n=1 Tax=uncultured Sphingosinicella sp. TaxID=478748 RepID=UPI0030DCDBD7
MLPSLLPVRSLLAAIFMLMAGGGVLSTLTSVRLEESGAGTLRIGLVATAYFAGLTVGSLHVHRIIAGVGHIRAFTAFVSLFSASTLAYALHLDPLMWSALRFIDGLCIAGVFICLESWLNERAAPETRGLVLAGYMIALYSGQAAGQFLLGIGMAGSGFPFIVASILISLSAIPVALTRITAPVVGVEEPLALRRLYDISPLGIVGTTVTGIMMGAFYGLGAIYARRLGMDLAATATFMSAVILGGVALQWPLGKLSDRFDRRIVIVFTFGAAALTSMLLAFLAAPDAKLLAAGALFGGLVFALYPLCVAHTNDHLRPDERVAASGGLVLFYSAGAAAGPIVGGGAMTFANNGLFLLLATCAAGVLAFGIWRLRTSPPVPDADQQAYQTLPRTTPMAATLDPRGSEQ